MLHGGSRLFLLCLEMKDGGSSEGWRKKATCPCRRSQGAALSCNENDGDHLDRDQQYPSNQKTKRMRTSFKHHQLRTMKSYFAINHNPDAKDLKQLAQKTGLTKRVLQVREVKNLALAPSRAAAFFLEYQKDNPVAPTARFVGTSFYFRQAKKRPGSLLCYRELQKRVKTAMV
uniref:Uncharacterized protein n=1 Tax=Sphaerodactylus townsendi TaxID=933632 RepID=A0ACB8EZK0_9SAUR